MSNLPTKFANAGLPSANALMQSLANVGAGDPSGGANTFDGRELLKMVRQTGEWVFGQNGTPVGDDERIAVNPYSFQHGYICWVGGEPVGEVMMPITSPLPDMSTLDVHMLPAEPKKGLPERPASWDFQLRFDAELEADGTELLYKVTSQGGKQAVQTLTSAIVARAGSNPEAFVPIIVLANDSYKHGTYGLVWKPIFNIVDWVDMDGLGADAEEEVDDDTVDQFAEDEPPADEPPPAPATARRRRRTTA